MVLDTSTFASIWDTVLSRIEREINDRVIYNAYFESSYIKSIENNKFIVVAPSRFAAVMINSKYYTMIKEFLSDVTQTNFDIQIIDEATANSFNENLHMQGLENKEKPFESNLNPKFNFESFVVGPSNRECYTAALSTAMNPGNFFNPLFIFGKSGLGKTHLLHAIGNYVKDKNPGAKILYLTTEDFLINYIKAIKEKSWEVLRDKYKEVDVFLLDDVQFLSKKDKTKEAFFHIFNMLINDNKQIVLTADRPPEELKDLEARLVGRFSSGLSIEIQALEYETALKILKKKVENANINDGKIDDDVLEFVAKNYSSDVRQLEGALNKLLFFAITYNEKEEIDMNVAMSAFKPSLVREDINPVTIEKIKYTVAEFYNISVSQLTSKIRQNNLVIPRHVAMYLCKVMLDPTWAQIGMEFGGKDHTTVINAYNKVDKIMKKDPGFIDVINKLKNIISGK